VGLRAVGAGLAHAGVTAKRLDVFICEGCNQFCVTRPCGCSDSYVCPLHPLRFQTEP
jgi:hypothetical protein